MTVFNHNSLRTAYDRMNAVEPTKAHEKDRGCQKTKRKNQKRKAYRPKECVIAALPDGIQEQDVTWLSWIEHFGTRYRPGQYVMLGRRPDAFPDDIDFGRIVALYRHEQSYSMVCQELKSYPNPIFDGYEVLGTETYSVCTIESLLDYLPLEGYQAGENNTTVLVLHHYPIFHPDEVKM